LAIESFTRCLALDKSLDGAGIDALLGQSFLAIGNLELAHLHLGKAFAEYEVAKRDGRPTDLTRDAELQLLRSLAMLLTTRGDTVTVRRINETISSLTRDAQRGS